jgi:hypothetical protein
MCGLWGRRGAAVFPVQKRLVRETTFDRFLGPSTFVQSVIFEMKQADKAQPYIHLLTHMLVPWKLGIVCHALVESESLWAPPCRYCGRDCQVERWSTHKPLCDIMVKARSERQ